MAQRAIADDAGSESSGRLERAYVRHEYVVVYAVAAISYTLLGLKFTWLLNWIVGPLWPVAFMWWGPVLVRRVTGWKAPLP